MKRYAVVAVLVASVAGLTATAGQATTGTAGAYLLFADPSTGRCDFFVEVAGAGYEAAGTFSLSVSTSGDVHFQCTGELIRATPDSALMVSPGGITRGCWNGSTYPLTLDWRVVITPGGNAKLTCRT